MTKNVPSHVKETTFFRSESDFQKVEKPPFSILDNVNVETAGPFSNPAQIHKADFRQANVRSLLSSPILTSASRSIRAELFPKSVFSLMYRQLRCRNTDRGSGSLASDVLQLLCRERFESKLTKELPFIFPALLILGMCSSEAPSNLRNREIKRNLFQSI